jgi:hypothetical protein
MKRASYREAVATIANNDEPEELDADAMSGVASVLVVAVIFGTTQERVASDVVRYRKLWK